jgi:cobalt-zinc-cadmium efflux system membrane fusion protein
MKKLFFMLMLLPFIAMAHGDDDPGAAKSAAGAKITYFSKESVSDKYELLIKYGELKPGAASKLKLFISDFVTNQPIKDAQLQLGVADDASIKLIVKKVDEGVYELMGIFPSKKKYDITVNIDSKSGPDLLLLPGIEIGKELPYDEPEATPSGRSSVISKLLIVVAFLGGLGIMFLIMQRRNKKLTATLTLIYFLLPNTALSPAFSHDEPTGGKSSGATSNTLKIEKETQFLFDIKTGQVSSGNFNESTIVLGTIVPAPQGMAQIQSPQTGKIRSLNVTVGQYVKKGQRLAVMEQQVDAATQLNFLSQKNTVDAEYLAATQQYERLKSIADIAAKKDVTEAKARYETASRNRQLLNASTSGTAGSAKITILISPINGVVGTFNFALGSIINAGQTIFEITDLNKVYVEAQAYPQDIQNLKEVKSFTVRHAVTTDTSKYSLKLISNAQSVNAGNQSQKIIFEVLKSRGQLKVGENVNISITKNQSSKQVIVPNDAIIEINGKPAVFLKDKAEQYTIAYVATGDSNGQYTVIKKGAEEGERIVTTDTYKLKMIFLNQ